MSVCGRCGHSSAAFCVCPYCRGSLSPHPDPADAHERAGVPAPAAPGVPDWEDSAVAFPENLARTWWSSVLQPAAFFAGGAGCRPVVRPVLYFLIVVMLTVSLWLTWGAVVPGSSPGPVQEVVGMINPVLADAEAAWSRPALLLASFLLTPFAALVYLTAWSLIVHLVVVMLAPGRRAFTATVRTICYASGPWLLSIVPWVGMLAGLVWEVVLTVIGLREAHRMSTGRAFATWMLALIVPVGGILFAALVAIILSVAGG